MTPNNLEISVSEEEVPSFSNIPLWAESQIKELKKDLKVCNKDNKRSELLCCLSGYYLLLGEIKKARDSYKKAEKYDSELPGFEIEVLEELPTALGYSARKGDDSEKMQAAIFSATLLLLVFEDFDSYEEEINMFLDVYNPLASTIPCSENEKLITNALKRINLDGCMIGDIVELETFFYCITKVHRNLPEQSTLDAWLYLLGKYPDLCNDVHKISELASILVSDTGKRIRDAEEEKRAKERAEQERNMLNYFAHNIKAGIGGLNSSVNFIQRYLNKKYDLSGEQIILDRFLVLKNALTLTTSLMDGYKLLTQDPEKLRKSIEADSIDMSLTVTDALEKALFAAFAENPFNRRLLLSLSNGKMAELKQSFFEKNDFENSSLYTWIKLNLPNLGLKITGNDCSIGWVSYSLLFAIFSESIKNAFIHGHYADSGNASVRLELEMGGQTVTFICENPIMVGQQINVHSEALGGTGFVEKIVNKTGGKLIWNVSEDVVACHINISRSFITSGRN